MNLSLRESLSKIGEPKSGQSVVAVPGGFHSTPGSLRSIIRAMSSPQIADSQEVSEGEFSNEVWTEECQGVANDGQNWLISSNNDGQRRIYRFSRDMKQIDFHSVEHTGCKHLGDIDFHKGKIYAAMEKPARILTVDADFGSDSLALLSGTTAGSPSPQGDSLPWCAINPWNGYLYSSSFDHASEIYAYDPNDNFVLKKILRLEVETDRVQGGCFSKNGHLLLASDATFDIRCYSVLNGAFLGSAAIEINNSPLVSEEVEGITIWQNLNFDGGTAHVHLILLDDDFPDRDDVYFKHYTMPNAQDL